ncbi:MAG TPA: hypothetical protein VMW01_07200, partial [Williamwhitmania sp.]|nr:hypothetical protein [Williamwhitmania sp.]
MKLFGKILFATVLLVCNVALSATIIDSDIRIFTNKIYVTLTPTSSSQAVSKIYVDNSIISNTIMPKLAATNYFTGYNVFSNGITLSTESYGSFLKVYWNGMNTAFFSNGIGGTITCMNPAYDTPEFWWKPNNEAAHMYFGGTVSGSDATTSNQFMTLQQGLSFLGGRDAYYLRGGFDPTFTGFRQVTLTPPSTNWLITIPTATNNQYGDAWIITNLSSRIIKEGVINVSGIGASYNTGAGRTASYTWESYITNIVTGGVMPEWSDQGAVKVLTGTADYLPMTIAVLIPTNLASGEAIVIKSKVTSAVNTPTITLVGGSNSQSQVSLPTGAEANLGDYVQLTETRDVSLAGSNNLGTVVITNRLALTPQTITFSETADDNMGLESVTYPIGNSQTGSVWLGYATLYDAPGGYNSALGNAALYQSTGSYNSAVGNVTLQSSPGSYNSGLGYSALFQSPGDGNTAAGYTTLRQAPGSYNFAGGYGAGYKSGGVSNVFLGANAAVNGTLTYYTNAIAIG